MLVRKQWVKTEDRHGTLYFFSDGSVRPEPPAASSAVVVKDEAGQILEWCNQLLPPVSSIEAEYAGLLLALEVAGRLLPGKACFHLDNQAVVGQVTGQYRVRMPKLKPLHQQVQEAMARLRQAGCGEIEVYHISREINLLADALAADALLLMPDRQRKRKEALPTMPK